jgi:L-ascorbate metabolism protein UlaG (beta-lactamase superfamily)
LTDPYLDDSFSVPLKAKDIERADYIFVTHGHFDHVLDVSKIAAARFYIKNNLPNVFKRERVMGINDASALEIPEDVRIPVKSTTHSEIYWPPIPKFSCHLFRSASTTQSERSDAPPWNNN